MGTKERGTWHENHTSISDLKQLTIEWIGRSEGLDEIPSEQCASKNRRLDGSSGICWRFLQWLKSRAFRLESRLMPAGMLLKWFQPRYNSSKDVRWQIWLRIFPSIRLQSRRDNCCSGDRFQISPGIPSSVGLHLVRDNFTNEDRWKILSRIPSATLGKFPRDFSFLPWSSENF